MQIDVCQWNVASTTSCIHWLWCVSIGWATIPSSYVRKNKPWTVFFRQATLVNNRTHKFWRVGIDWTYQHRPTACSISHGLSALRKWHCLTTKGTVWESLLYNATSTILGSSHRSVDIKRCLPALPLTLSNKTSTSNVAFLHRLWPTDNCPMTFYIAYQHRHLRGNNG